MMCFYSTLLLQLSILRYGQFFCHELRKFYEKSLDLRTTWHRNLSSPTLRNFRFMYFTYKIGREIMPFKVYNFSFILVASLT